MHVNANVSIETFPALLLLSFAPLRHLLKRKRTSLFLAAANRSRMDGQAVRLTGRGHVAQGALPRLLLLQCYNIVSRPTWRWRDKFMALPPTRPPTPSPTGGDARAEKEMKTPTPAGGRGATC